MNRFAAELCRDPFSWAFHLLSDQIVQSQSPRHVRSRHQMGQHHFFNPVQLLQAKPKGEFLSMRASRNFWHRSSSAQSTLYFL